MVRQMQIHPEMLACIMAPVKHPRIHRPFGIQEIKLVLVKGELENLERQALGIGHEVLNGKCPMFAEWNPVAWNDIISPRGDVPAFGIFP